MLKRKIFDELVKWKNNTLTKKKALVIKGLRQIGKTFIVKQFANEYYENQIYINFKNNDDIKAVFEEKPLITSLYSWISTRVEPSIESAI